MTIVLANLNAYRDRVQVDYSTRIRPAWQVDAHAVERACELLGVNARVRIYLSESRRGRWLGSQHWDEANEEHVVMLCRRLTVAGVSRTLWHELTHCAQTERGEDLYVDASSSRRARMGSDQYSQLPGEAEAAANERHADTHPLARR